MVDSVPATRILSDSIYCERLAPTCMKPSKGYFDEESFPRSAFKEYAGFDNNGQPRLTPSEVPLLCQPTPPMAGDRLHETRCGAR